MIIPEFQMPDEAQPAEQPPPPAGSKATSRAGADLGLTIAGAIMQVMRRRNAPMTVQEIHEEIISAGLYQFKAENPLHIVRSQIRRHCAGIDFPSAHRKKYFALAEGDKFSLAPTAIPAAPKKRASTPVPRTNLAAQQVRKAHEQHLKEFRKRTLDGVLALTPRDFERFCRNLLGAYGFRDVAVTRVCKDGGVDGYGRLKVGFAYFNVAFQCKKWKAGSIGRPDIDQFRGAIQGQYEQGIYFTTARFSEEAKKSSFKPGAVSIILVDGPTIIDIMIEKQFGIEREELPLYSLALDLALSDGTES